MIRKYFRKVKSYSVNNPKKSLFALLFFIFLVGWFGISYIQYSYSSEVDMSKWIEDCRENALESSDVLFVGRQTGECLVQNYDLSKVNFNSSDKSSYQKRYTPFLGHLFSLDIKAEKTVDIPSGISRGIRVELAGNYLERAKDLRSKKEYQQAIDLHEKAVDELDNLEEEYPSKLSDIHLSLAQTYNLGGEKITNFPQDKAVEYAKKAVNINEDNPLALKELGRFYILDDRYDLAKEKLRESIKKIKINIERSKEDREATTSEEFEEGLKVVSETVRAEANVLIALACVTEISKNYENMYFVPSELKDCARNHYFKAKELDPDNSRLSPSLESSIESLR